MKDAVEDGILMEFWDVDLKGENAEGKYPAIYAQGYVNSEFTSQCRRISRNRNRSLYVANHKMVLQQ